VQRKTVTVLFCDVTGSTALGESVDPEALRGMLVRYFERMKTIVESHGGTVEKFIGDAVMAVFGVPVAHEDDALRAVRAGAEMLAVLPELGFEARIGVNTGEVVTGTEERLVTGDAVNVAARLEQAAQPGEMLIGEATLGLVRDAIEAERVEPLALKGKATVVTAHRLVRVREAPHPRHRGVFVGRARELVLLGEVWEQTRGEQHCELVTIVGEAGVGKSRLVSEFLSELKGRVVRGRALPYGEGITYWPVVEVLKELGVRPPREAAPAIRALLGETEAVTSAEEIAWAFRKTLEHAAAEQPLVVVFDDIQWAEERFLDLIEHMALLSSGTTILMLLMARPELTERRATWPVTLHLKPLAEEEVEELIPKRIARQLREKMARAAGGNPLFIQEMVAMAGDADARVVVPPTLHALLTARLDQLDPRERRVLECGSVEGEVFHRGAVQALAPSELQVTPQLAGLVRKELIRPNTSEFPGEDGFRFRHLLIRDAAYDGLPKATRAELHERCAAWLDERAKFVAQDEIVGYHLEQAARYRQELGAPNPRLAEAAATRLGAAARSALDQRGDWTATCALLRQALDLVPEEHPLRLDMLPTYVVAFWDVELGRPAQAAIDELLRSQDERAVAFGSMLAASRRIFKGGGGDLEELELASEHARAIFERLGDEAGLAHAYNFIAIAKVVRGRNVDMMAACERALGYARRANAVFVENECEARLAGAQLWGPAPVPDAIAYCERRLHDFPEHARVAGDLKIVLGSLYAVCGEIEKGRDLIRASRELRRDAGLETWAAAARIPEARLEWYAGDLGRAEDLARVGLAELEELEDRESTGTMTLFLARYLEEQGKLDEAEAVLRRARQLTNPAEVRDALGLDAIEARLLAQRGRIADAEKLARRAHAAASPTDLYMAHIVAASSLAFVLELAGRMAEAQEEIEYALGVAEAKGDTVYASRLRARRKLSLTARQDS
jgi:class 3 adenylate cyclase/tetratricopeptide (TPR) repeat protein